MMLFRFDIIAVNADCRAELTCSKFQFMEDSVGLEGRHEAHIESENHLLITTGQYDKRCHKVVRKVVGK